jgi:hypothetical protein
MALLGTAPDVGAFLLRLPVPLLVLGALVLWVVRSDAAFEESAATQAREVARTLQAVREGRLLSAGAAPRKTARRSPWRLSPSGSPEGAFVWKGFVELWRQFSPLFLAMVPVLVAVVAVLDHLVAERTGRRVPIATGILGGILVLSQGFTLSGQGLASLGFRDALRRADLLKTFPVHAPRLVRCLLLAPLAPIALAQCGLAAAAVAMLPPLPGGPVTTAWRAAILGAAWLVLPALTAILLALDAAVVVLFPALARPSAASAAAGLENMGQNLLALLVKAAGAGAALTLPVAAGVLTVFAAFHFGAPALRPAALLVGAALFAAAAATEILLFSRWIGARWEALDPAEEELTA